MSYDIWLTADTGGPEPACIVHIGNYTSNVHPMWHEALGHSLADLDGRTAGDCAGPLAAAASRMETGWAQYEAMNPANGWGDAHGACNYLVTLARACAAHPEATIRISH